MKKKETIYQINKWDIFKTTDRSLPWTDISLMAHPIYRTEFSKHDQVSHRETRFVVRQLRYGIVSKFA